MKSFAKVRLSNNVSHQGNCLAQAEFLTLETQTVLRLVAPATNIDKNRATEKPGDFFFLPHFLTRYLLNGNHNGKILTVRVGRKWVEAKLTSPIACFAFK